MKTSTKKSTSLNVDQLEDRLVPATFNYNLGADGVLRIQGTNDANTIRVVQTATQVAIDGGPVAYRASAVKAIVVDAAGGNDVVDLRNVAVPCTVQGGAGHDTIYGGQNADVLRGGDHDDRIWAGGGNDSLYGDNGDDRLFGNEGYDSIFGGYGADFMDDCSRTAHEYYAAENDGSVDTIADMFGPAGKTLPEHVKQGSANYTCWYLATLQGLAQGGVNFSSYIQYTGYSSEGVGIYNVSLYNGQQWIKMPVLFEGHTAATDAQLTTDYASWTTIMGRAMTQFYGNQGGTPTTALRALGRNPAVATSFTNETYAAINSSLSRGLAVVVGTTNAPGSNLEGGHAYQVVRTGTINGVACVLLRNPWAYDGGSANDGNTRDGLIWITWAQFTRSMKSLTAG